MENLNGLDYTNVGAWVVITFYLLEKVLLPVVSKFLPMRTALQSREQDRKDKAADFENEMKLRNVEVLEELKRNAIQQTEISRVTNERLTNIEGTVKEINIAILSRRRPSTK